MPKKVNEIQPFYNPKQPANMSSAPPAELIGGWRVKSLRAGLADRRPTLCSQKQRRLALLLNTNFCNPSGSPRVG